MNKASLAESTGVTVESILKSPLLRFINFAANDCGYSGTKFELVVNLVHPLFLKTYSKASMQENSNWHQAMNIGEFAAEFWDAACTEIETLE